MRVVIQLILRLNFRFSSFLLNRRRLLCFKFVSVFFEELRYLKFISTVCEHTLKELAIKMSQFFFTHELGKDFLKDF